MGDAPVIARLVWPDGEEYGPVRVDVAEFVEVDEPGNVVDPRRWCRTVGGADVLADDLDAGRGVARSLPRWWCCYPSKRGK